MRKTEIQKTFLLKYFSVFKNNDCDSVARGQVTRGYVAARSFRAKYYAHLVYIVFKIINLKIKKTTKYLILKTRSYCFFDL